MNIRKVSLNDSGFKGCEVHFFEEVEKNGRKSMELTKKYPKNPVHLGLEKLFKDLRIHLLEICGLVNDQTDKDIKDMTINQTFVDTVEFDTECIIISGEKQVFDEKYIKLKTCKLQAEDEYEHYESLRAIVDSISDEVKEYLAGSKKVEDAELILRYAQMKHKEDEFNEEKLKTYTPEQLKEIATKIIEKGLGGIVMLPTDLEPDEAVLNETVQELVTEFEIKDDADVIPIDIPAETKKSKKTKKQDKVLVSDEKGNLSVAAPFAPENETEDTF